MYPRTWLKPSAPDGAGLGQQSRQPSASGSSGVPGTGGRGRIDRPGGAGDRGYGIVNAKLRRRAVAARIIRSPLIVMCRAARNLKDDGQARLPVFLAATATRRAPASGPRGQPDVLLESRGGQLSVSRQAACRCRMPARPAGRRRHADKPDNEPEQDDLDPLGLKALPVHVDVILADPADPADPADRALVGGLRHLSAPLPEVDALPVHPEMILSSRTRNPPT